VVCGFLCAVYKARAVQVSVLRAATRAWGLGMCGWMIYYII
jgi:hypothetical protein